MTTMMVEQAVCKACGGKSESADDTCWQCEQLGLQPAMTPREMLKHVIQRAARVDDELQTIKERHENDDVLLKTVAAWHRARFVACPDDRHLAHTEEDLRDTCRWYFER